MKIFLSICLAVVAFATSCLNSFGQQVGTATGPGASTLTIDDAERLAVQNNPRISVAQLLQRAQAQVTREVRSGLLPFAGANLTAVDAHEGSVLTAGALGNSNVYPRAAGGLTISQLITDFGRTRNLLRSAESQDRAQQDAQRAATADIILAVDEIFYQALTNQALLKVAQQTVAARQATADQIGALSASKLKSALDLSFANVELSQARLLLLNAKNAAQDSMANLNALLGSELDRPFNLVDPSSSQLQSAPAEAEPLVDLAFQSRPDLAAINESYKAAQHFSAAEHALGRPTLSVLAAVGGTPVRADQITSSWYGGVGANLSIPIFNGFLYSARAREADLRANAAQEERRSLRELIARDVRIAVLATQAAYQRIEVSKQLRDQSNQALDLAQTRYQLGLSGIVELSQAQLAQTQGEIAYNSARYAYQSALAVLRFQTGQ